jgi:hypothetical protein
MDVNTRDFVHPRPAVPARLGLPTVRNQQVAGSSPIAGSIFLSCTDNSHGVVRSKRRGDTLCPAGPYKTPLLRYRREGVRRVAARDMGAAYRSGSGVISCT